MAKTDLHTKLYNLVQKEISDLDLPQAPKSLYHPYAYAMEMGGKRIRPILTLLANGLCEGNIQDAIPSALAIEILHNFTLVHDDIMDKADTRRGKPSVFKKWDQDTAILSGDVMFAHAFKKLEFYGSSDEFTKQEFFHIQSSFTEATITVCEGQAMDMDFVNRADVDHLEYIEMIKGKTSALLAGSFKMGAISAHATDSQIQSLFNLGIEMGIAFQIQDDLLDAIADPDKFGKRQGGDIYEGKKTYLTILALERSNNQQKEIINSTLSDNNCTTEQVTLVLDIMEQLNIISDTKKEVQKHYDSAIKFLDQFKESDYKQELKNLLTFLKNRDH